MISGLWFIAVGIAAASTHLIVFALLHQRLAPWVWPEAVNGLAFLVAFFVSFSGHRLLSFKDAGTTLKQSFARFAFSASLGFLANEIVFSSLLHIFNVPPLPALLVALTLAAGQTFLLSRFWAFSR